MQLRTALGWSLGIAAVDVLASAALFTEFFTSDAGFRIGGGHYDYLDSLLELLLLGVLRPALLIGAVGGVLVNADAARARLASLHIWVAIVCVAMASYSPLKLLALDEQGDLGQRPYRLALLAWNYVAAIFFFAAVTWLSLPEKAEAEDEKGDDEAARLVDNDHLQDTTADGAPKKKETLRNSGRLIGRLLTYCKTEWPLYLVGFTCLFIYSAARIFIPYYMAQVISNIVTTSSSTSSSIKYEQLKHSIFVMMGLSLTSALFGGLRGGCFMYAMSRVNRLIRGDLFASLTRQEMGFFDLNKTGELTSRLTADCQTMSDSVGVNINVLLRNLVMFIGSLVVMVELSWQMTMITFIVIPLVGLVSKLYGAYYDRLSKETQDSIAKANEVADEVLASMRTVRSFAAEEEESQRYRERLDGILRIKLKQTFAYVGYVWNNETFDLLILTAVLWYGGHLVIGGRISSANLISFLLYQLQLGENLIQMGAVYTGLMQSVGASRKVFEYIDRKPAILYNGTFAPVGAFAGAIEFQDVDFAYPSRPDKPVIKKMNLSIAAGETVALVGPSGGGKSSTIALLQHFYEPQGGRILVDGVPLTAFDHHFYHGQVSLVSQEPVLFGRTVGENIEFGLLDGAAAMSAEAAAGLANADTFVNNFSDGFKTQVGEKGAQLSGGQKQRVAIARSLVRGPKVLLLDEATSALDSESEHLVQEAIYANLSGRTVILIAHRLSTVERADRIVVINDGEIVEIGTHAKLLAAEGLYANLVHRQLFGANAQGPPSTKPSKPVPRRTSSVESPTTSFRSISPASSPRV